MRELLSPKDIHHRIALAGLGGAGKSMIALKYALDLKKAEDMTSIFWVNASSRFQIEEGYRLIAKAANLPGAEEEDADILRIVYEWLSSDKCGEWLMVLDNADRLDVFMDRLEEGSCQKPVWNFIPQNSQGSIIFTTRDTAIGYKLTAEAERRPIVKIPKMPLDRALLLLESKVEFNVGDRRIAEELVEQLDCLPISIIQASSYMQQMQIGVAEYLERYKEDESTRAVLLQHEITSLMKGTEDSQEHEIHTSIVKTWAISFEQIRKANLPAAELLSLLGVLDGSGYPKFLIEAIYSDFARYSAATKDLLTLSLIWPTTDAFEIHSTVYWVTRAWLLNRSVFGKWAEEALSLISSNFPDEDYDSKQWEKCRQLLPHANVVLQRSVCADRLRQQRARLLRTSGGYLHRRGDFTNGLQRLKEAHEIGIKISMDDSFIWGTYDRIGSCLGEAGRFREAEPYSEKAFEHFRDLHGLSHKDTLESLSSLATSLNGQGRYRESEKLYRQAMIGYEKLHGPDHPHTLIAVNNLAHSLRDLERLEEAEMLNQRCLDTRKKVLAPNNPLIFVSMNNLASIQLSRKKYPQAISVYRDALERLEEILTTKHPTTLSTMNNLAAALKGNGQKKDAQEMFEKVIALKEEHLGLNHVSTLRSLYHLASVLRDQGFIERARETCEIMIERSEIALGCDDPETLRARNLLSDIIQQGR
ncbi:Kinesin light chain [Lasiodiplodia theobromae]|uniref:Kinesin light chain n=1 Tax=Lasiodiplodia theobromae TaxID=45133 RepID=UPI0015C3F058|nr:Kinesin light chain [Lasiodiplodia theobromae]KAF4540599.1 Kinesin light chain [Lasiodiplodia theobromae]